MPEKGWWRIRVNVSLAFLPPTTQLWTPFVHTLMHVRSPIGTHLRAWRPDTQTGCENGRFKGRPAAAEAGRRRPWSWKRFYLFFCSVDLSLRSVFFCSFCLEPRSIHLLNCALRLAIARQTSTKNRALRAASIRHRAHSWDFWRRDITAQQRDCKPEHANRENSRPCALASSQSIW